MASIKLLAAGLALVLVAGCSQPPQEPAPAPSVLLLVLDGLRADRVDGPVGSFRARFGPESVVFERAYAPSSLAQQSLASLFAGRLPTHGGGIGLAEAQPAAEATTLASAMRGAGYRSALVSQAVWAGRPGYTRGFGDLQIAPEQGWSDRQVADKAIQVLEDWQLLDHKRADGSGRPWFLVVHWTGPRTQDAALGGEVSEAAYDAVITDRGVLIDAFLEDILGRVDLGDPVVVLTSGHGFELMEHGGVGSGWTLHEEAIRVPLLLRLPGAAARSVSEPVSVVRLGATLRSLAGTDPGEGAPPVLLDLAAAPAGSEAPVVVELIVRERVMARATIVAKAGQRSEKYLRILRDVPLADREAVANGYEELQAAMLSGAVPTPALFGDAQREQLFLLSSDPQDLGEDEVALAEAEQMLSRLRAVMRTYRELCETSAWAPPEIDEKLIIDVDDAAQLQALGYM